MPQYDGIMRFADLATALADPVVGEHIDAETGTPKSSHAMVVKVWRHSQDTISTDAEGNEVRTHNYLPGYYIWVSVNRDIPALRNHAAVQLIVNRDKLNAREPGGVIRRTVSAAILQDIRISPVFAGCEWNFGGLD